jgi:hypothetical protein
MAGSIITGCVFDDNNKNGKRDRSEKGVAGVPVSNGTDVTLTDAKGIYRMEVDDDNIVFVIKPSGYRTGVDEYNIPRFFYIHKPNGSPATRYKGVSPTGAIPKSVDFPLYKYDEPDKFTALIFGDTQAYSEEDIGFIERGVVAEVIGTKEAAFGITLGDLVGDNLDLHKPYRDVIGKIGLPWYNVMGNHDVNYDATTDKLSDETFESGFGPNNYSFNYGKAHFIVLDDILCPNPATGKNYIGGLRDDQMQFVENDLKHVPADRLVVVALHIPLTEGISNFRDSDRQRLYAIFDKYPKVLILSAHTHFQCQGFAGRNIHEYNVGTVCGDWNSGTHNKDGIPLSIMRDGTPPGYAFLRIDGNSYATDYKVRNYPASYLISIYNPKVVRARHSTSAAIYANFFMGSSRDELSYRVDDGEWRAMQRREEFDPAYYRYVQDWDFLDSLVPGRRPSNPIICRHLWRGDIPTNLPTGKHRIEVRAKDMFGREFIQSNSFLISDL